MHPITVLLKTARDARLPAELRTEALNEAQTRLKVLTARWENAQNIADAELVHVRTVRRWYADAGMHTAPMGRPKSGPYALDVPGARKGLPT